MVERQAESEGTSERIAEVEARYRLAARATNDAIWDWNLQDDHVQWNEALAKSYGHALHEVPPTAAWWVEHIHPDDRERVVHSIHDVIDGTETAWSAEYRFRRADGSFAAVLDRGYVLRDAAQRGVRMIGSMLDLSELRRMQGALDEAAQRVVLATEAADVGTFDWNIVTGDLVWDARCRELFGLRGEHAVDFALFLRGLHPEDRARTDLAVQDALSPTGTRRYAAEYRTIGIDDGEERWVSARGKALFEGGTAVRLMGTVLDVTAAKRVERERAELLAETQRARDEAERVNRLKDDFLATVSHELRTPLNAILGWARLLSAGLAADRVSHAISTIERNARAQAQLVDDLLDVSRIIAGKMRLEPSLVDVGRVADAALEVVRPAADAKGVKLVRAVDVADLTVSADPDRLQQIVWNLLTNAVKFTTRGGSVQLSVRRREALVELTVEDTGKGISADFLRRVFSRFEQEDSGISRSYGGLGLGLAIVRHLVELHGGSVSAHSAGEGQGASFKVCLPLAAPAGALSASQRTHEGASDALLGLRVLVVDDDPDARELVTSILGACGARATAAASAQEALAALEGGAFDLLISDIGMPVQDGYTLMRAVRTRGLGIRALALTAFAQTSDRRLALEAGFDQHLAKPTEPQQLLNAVLQLMRAR